MGLPDFDDKETISNVIDYMIAESERNVKKDLPHLREHVQKIQNSRGAGLETAIMSEQVFNHILSYMGFSWKNIMKLTYGNKILEVIKILEDNAEKDDWRDETITNLKKIGRLRNIYAHVPGDYQSGILRFSQSDEYYKEEDTEFRSKLLEELNSIFSKLGENINKSISEIFKRLIPIREKQKAK